MSELAANVPRFVVVAPLGRDGDLISGFLNGAGFPAENLQQLRGVETRDGAMLLGLILTDEALQRGGLDAVRRLVRSQPVWSDLPVILLTSSSTEPGCAALASQARIEVRSLILLDRPIRKEMLLSAIQVAFNARQKQLQVRDAAVKQFQSDEALKKSEHLAVAGRLVATLAHEVNNPLEALGNLLFLVENSSTLDEAHSFGQLAIREFHRISEIVDHTLKFHRAPAHPSFTDVSELAMSAVTLFRGKLRERQIRERVTAERAFGYCSEGEIRQALVNLIGNAVDAMKDGGSLRIHVMPVSVDGVEYARMTVADTGGGIRKEIRPQLFRQFFTTKGSSGTGLGLWLTRDIVERNGGKLRFRSRTETPCGTVFAIYLPSSPPLEQPKAVQDRGQGAGLQRVAAAM
ncbi:MAG: HAMP domain-containing histidine kinase [Acidobacteria bacterium]|nr:HAMP domain-containing histidine kinase [Acidobacteriota bacterium]